MCRLMLTLFVLLSFGVAHASAIEGKWSGKAYQNIGSSNYTAILMIGKSGGATYYPELNCRGKLKRIAAAKGYVFYTETITPGRHNCIDGTVTMRVIGRKLSWGWVGVSKGKTFAGWGEFSRE